jgi:hypothetical protein
VNLTFALLALTGVAAAQDDPARDGLDSMVSDAMSAPILDEEPEAEDLSSDWSDVPFMSDAELAKFEGTDESRQRIATFRQIRQRYQRYIEGAKKELEARGVETDSLDRRETLLTRLKARYADVIATYGYQLDWPSYSVNELRILHSELRGGMPVTSSFTIPYGGVRAYLNVHATSEPQTTTAN